jgi:chemotaxis signal transduction protein
MEVYAADPATRPASKVLVFAVDDAFLGVHLEWVDAVYPHATTERHLIKVDGRSQPFLLHRGEPAFAIDPRTLFRLPSAGGAIERSSSLVMRTGSHLLALGIDVCVGVEELDLELCPPIPAAVAGDGGVPVGHLVDLHGRIVVVLDPNRLIDGAGREAMARAYREAGEYLKRESQLAALWPEIGALATAANLRRYGRLCRRNGRPKTARLIRTIGKVLAEAENGSSNGNGSGEPAFAGDLVTVLVRLSRHASTGALFVVGADGGEQGRIVLAGGSLIDAASSRSHGTQALSDLLSRRDVGLRFVEGGPHADTASRFTGGTIACLIEAAARSYGERGARA